MVWYQTISFPIPVSIPHTGPPDALRLSPRKAAERQEDPKPCTTWVLGGCDQTWTLGSTVTYHFTMRAEDRVTPVSLTTPQYRPGRAGQTKRQIDTCVASEGRRHNTHKDTHRHTTCKHTQSPSQIQKHTGTFTNHTQKNTTTLTHYMPTHTLT